MQTTNIWLLRYVWLIPLFPVCGHLGTTSECATTSGFEERGFPVHFTGTWAMIGSSE